MASLVSGQSDMELADIGVLVGYFVVLLAFGIWSSLKNRGSVGGYFLAGRNMNFLLVGASLFASNIGSGHFIGLSGSGASTGIGVAVYELSAMFVLFILGWFFLPVYISSGVFTMPEYMKKRFGGQRIRVTLAVLALLLYIITKLSADLFAGALFIRLSLGWNMYASVGLLLVISGIFTVTGGLTAVIWTDFIQTIIMLAGAIYLMVVGFMQMGNYDVISRKFMQAVPRPLVNQTLNDTYASCGQPPANSLHLMRHVLDPNFPWPGSIAGTLILGTWYWCTDQVIVQRVLAAKNFTHGKAGTVLAAYLKLLPLWINIVPGMMARILYTDEVACADPASCEVACGQRTGCTNMAYPLLVMRLMPVGARGLMVAVMMAALISSLTSIFNSSSTVFTMDIWSLVRKQASEAELMIVGRVFVVLLVGASIAWLPIVQSFSELYMYIQSIQSLLSAPVCAVYVLAMLWPRTNEQGAFWGLVIGLGIGLGRFIWENMYLKVACGEVDMRPAVLTTVHFLYFCIILFIVVISITVVISLLTKPLDADQYVRLTFWRRHSAGNYVTMSDNREVWAGDHSNHVYSTNTSTMDGIYQPSDNGATSQHASCFVRVVRWVCGVEKKKQEEMPYAATMAMMEGQGQQSQRSLIEDPTLKVLCDFNAICMLVLATFVWGFFS